MRGFKKGSEGHGSEGHHKKAKASQEGQGPKAAAASLQLPSLRSFPSLILEASFNPQIEGT
jgi:hypothetical protein